MLCEDSANIHPCLKTVAVKEGCGGRTTSISPSLACKLISETVCEALSQDFSGKLPTLPKEYTLEITYKEHVQATKMANYPGFKKIEDNTISLTSENFVDLLRAIRFVL